MNASYIFVIRLKKLTLMMGGEGITPQTLYVKQFENPGVSYTTYLIHSRQVHSNRPQKSGLIDVFTLE